jgi:2-polyprenyl-6-hydroxyphenyl methylase/3-demethylubiquinone-9 3-methyltransferase
MYMARFESVLGAIDKWASGKRVLDVGCAQGNFSLALAEQGYSVVALDLRASFLRYLRLKQERGEIRCVSASIEAFPFPHHGFDVVVLGEVIEHVAYPERLLRNLAELLSPGGILVLSTPNGERFHTGLPTLGDIKRRQELVKRQFKPDADGHLFLLTRHELVTLADEARLVVLSHQFICSPWVTGRLMARHVARFLPPPSRVALDRATVAFPGLARLLSDGQLLVATNRRQ